MTHYQGVLNKRVTKSDEARLRLLALAHQLGPDAKLPTVTEMRLSLGVSMATLSTVLEDLEARNVICRRHGVGVFVSPQLNKSIVLICDSSFFRSAGHSPFWDMTVDAARARAQDRREEFSCHFTLPHILGRSHTEVQLHRGLMEEIAGEQVQGVLGIGLDAATAEWIEAQNVPFVAFAGPAQAQVRLDMRDQFRMAIDALVRQGCRRIGFWSFVTPYRRTTQSDLQNKLQLFRDALQDAGVPFDADLVQNNNDLLKVESYTEVSQQAQGYRAALAACSGSNRPDGVFIDSDMVTHGALIALSQMGIVPGYDLQVASHANRNSAILMGSEKQITLLEIDPHEVVQCMFDLLEQRMSGEHPEEQTVFVSPRVKERPAGVPTVKNKMGFYAKPKQRDFK